MSCFTPKRKTASGVEEVTFPIASVNGLQDNLTDLGNKTIDKVDYLGIATPQAASTFHNTTASASIGDEGVTYNSACEISTDVDGSEVLYSFPLSTHIPIIPGENVSFEQNTDRNAIKINASPAMPVIRLANAKDSNNTMIIGASNPLVFSIEIIDGKLQVGDEMQICTRQLYTYKNNKMRKYKLRKQWFTAITSENVNNKYIFVSITDDPNTENYHFFTTGNKTGSITTLSPIYIRVRRPLYPDDPEQDATFSNIITVWKKYNRGTGKVYIK